MMNRPNNSFDSDATYCSAVVKYTKVSPPNKQKRLKTSTTKVLNEIKRNVTSHFKAEMIMGTLEAKHYFKILLQLQLKTSKAKQLAINIQEGLKKIVKQNISFEKSLSSDKSSSSYSFSGISEEKLKECHTTKLKQCCLPFEENSNSDKFGSSMLSNQLFISDESSNMEVNHNKENSKLSVSKELSNGLSNNVYNAPLKNFSEWNSNHTRKRRVTFAKNNEIIYEKKNNKNKLNQAPTEISQIQNNSINKPKVFDESYLSNNFGDLLSVQLPVTETLMSTRINKENILSLHKESKEKLDKSCILHSNITMDILDNNIPPDDLEILHKSSIKCLTKQLTEMNVSNHVCPYHQIIQEILNMLNEIKLDLVPNNKEIVGNMIKKIEKMEIFSAKELKRVVMNIYNQVQRILYSNCIENVTVCPNNYKDIREFVKKYENKLDKTMENIADIIRDIPFPNVENCCKMSQNKKKFQKVQQDILANIENLVKIFQFRLEQQSLIPLNYFTMAELPFFKKKLDSNYFKIF